MRFLVSAFMLLAASGFGLSAEQAAIDGWSPSALEGVVCTTFQFCLGRKRSISTPEKWSARFQRASFRHPCRKALEKDLLPL